MIRRRTNPDPDHPSINKSAVPKKPGRRSKWLTGKKSEGTLKRKEFVNVKGRTVLGKDGKIWIYEYDIPADDEPALNQLKAILEKNKKEFKFVRNGRMYDIFVRKD